MRTLKRYFISGLAVFTPFVLTVYVCFWLLNFAEGIFGKYLRAFLLDKYDFYVWGIGIIVLVVLILISGFFITNYFGRAVHRMTEKFMLKIPLMGSIYPAFKEIAGFLFQNEGESSKLGQVVLVEWPRAGVRTIGFLTNDTPAFIADKTGLDLVNVLIPTVPNPITGFFVIYPRDQVTRLDMTVEEAVKMIVSGGVVDPRAFMQNEKNPFKVKIVIFDLDGTLVDAYPAIADSVNHMLKVLGRPGRSARMIKRSVGWGVDDLIGRFVEEEKVPEGLAIFRAHHEQRLMERVRLLPGVKTLLPFLKKQGCVLAIASNRPTKFCRIILKALGIDSFFDEVLGADAVARPKPHPDVLKEILQRTKIKAVEALFVGDMSVDVLCGQRAGVFVAAVSTGSCTLAEIKAASPDCILSRISGVRALFPLSF